MGLVDCHFHVIAPTDLAPMTPKRGYTPAPAAVADWRATLGPLGVTHGVAVQPSFYGTDNRVLLAALEEGSGSLVGVAAVDAQVTDAELDRLVAAGVRGVRMAHLSADETHPMRGFVGWPAFDALEERLAERAMHVQLITDSRLLPAIAARLERSRVPVVIDHMGRAPARFGARHEGIRALVQLMRSAPLWVKLSGVANVSYAAPAYEDARAIHEALVEAAPDRLVWGSDWPHTRPAGERPDSRALLRLFHQWTPSTLHERIRWINAASLYRIGQT
jgi:2-pyrone-4,6-dicarboxylate lactonase